MQSLREKYSKIVVPKLQKELELKNPFSCPRVKKIVINVGVGRWVIKDTARRDEVLKKVSDDLALITGQKPQLRPAKQSISGFSLREGMPIGVKVTLRRKRMYDFLDKLININLPRVRDFQGVKKSKIDGHGNITIGIDEQLVFSEISADDTDFFFGMEITIVTSAKNREDGEKLLREIGFPLTS